VTSTADQNAHPEVTEISDLTEGLLNPERGAAVRAHIAGCSLCADVQGSLEEIRNLLGTLPGPQRMPADIAGGSCSTWNIDRPGRPPIRFERSRSLPAGPSLAARTDRGGLLRGRHRSGRPALSGRW
jgi:hypothetical protein